MKTARVIIVFFVVFLLGAAIISRLVILQIAKGDMYRAWAKGQERAFQTFKGERGRIFFSGNQILATNVKGRTVSVNPLELKNKEEDVKKISQILGLDEKALLEKLNKDELKKVKSGATEKETAELKNIEGVYVSDNESLSRSYPQKTMASQVVGFLGGEDEGQYGLEGYYNSDLEGKDLDEGISDDFLLTDYESDAKGNDLYLTLDYNIQYKAEELLKKANETLPFESGQIIVADPITGKILAMANYPNFDPNNYSDVSDFALFQNPSVQKLFEPGSVFKAITMVGALDKEKVNPDTKYVDTGTFKIGSHAIFNYGNRKYGEKTMTEVLENSINTGAVFAEQQLGKDDFMQYIDKFGFFKPTDIDLQAEASSENAELKKGYEFNYITASFGQGIEMTPIQLIRAYCAIANGGKMVKPYIVERISGAKGEKNVKPEITQEPIVSLKADSQIISMLLSVIEKGFSKKAKVPGYYIAGKTGTAQVPYSSLGIRKSGYSDKTWQSFIGFAPAMNPQFLALVKLDNPAAKTAEYSALPIFSDLAKYLFDYMQIPPDYEFSK